MPPTLVANGDATVTADDTALLMIALRTEPYVFGISDNIFSSAVLLSDLPVPLGSTISVQSGIELHCISVGRLETLVAEIAVEEARRRVAHCEYVAKHLSLSLSETR